MELKNILFIYIHLSLPRHNIMHSMAFKCINVPHMDEKMKLD